jgi:hypothetical protein
MAASAFTHTASGIASPGVATGGRASSALRGLAVRVRRAARKATIAGLVAALAAGSVALWTVVPATVLWVASRLGASSSQLSLGSCLAVAVGVPAAIALGAEALARLEQVYSRMTGATSPVRVVPGWRRSLRDSDALPPAGLLEKLMVASVLLALASLATWFFALAGSSPPA